MEEISIKVDNLTKRFGDFLAVDNISFEVKKGEIFGFLGPNGAGKTTAIRMLCAILDATSGSAQVAGHDINQEPERIKSAIGYMSQKFSLYLDLTVSENLGFFSGIYQPKQENREKRINTLMQLAGLEKYKDEITSNLSAGIKQRLALCCAIVHNPPVIFLDEPTAGVDPISRRSFWNLIYALAEQGTTILVTTHYMDEAEHCDRLALISNGRIIALDSPHNLKFNQMYGKVWEIECADPIKGLDYLRKHPDFMEVAMYGTKIHVSTRVDSAPALIKGILASNQIALSSMQNIVPTLEDVFVALVERRG